MLTRTMQRVTLFALPILIASCGPVDGANTLTLDAPGGEETADAAGRMETVVELATEEV